MSIVVMRTLALIVMLYCIALQRHALSSNQATLCCSCQLFTDPHRFDGCGHVFC